MNICVWENRHLKGTFTEIKENLIPRYVVESMQMHMLFTPVFLRKQYTVYFSRKQQYTHSRVYPLPWSAFLRLEHISSVLFIATPMFTSIATKLLAITFQKLHYFKEYKKIKQYFRDSSLNGVYLRIFFSFSFAICCFLLDFRWTIMCYVHIIACT